MIENELCPFQESENIEELIYYLREAQRGRGNIAFWIGAGVSKLAGYPLWGELVSQLVQNYRALHNSSNYDLEKNLDLIVSLQKSKNFLGILQIIKTDSKGSYETGIKNIFESAERNPCKDIDIFATIAKFVKKRVIVITTNLDRELENTLGIGVEQISVVPTNEIHHASHKVIYLHRRIDEPRSWVMTEEDYANAYDNELRPCNKFLESFLNQTDVLVIMGYGLGEREIYRKFLKPKARSDPRIFWIQLLDTCEKGEEFRKQVLYFRNALRLNIKPIPYREGKKLTNLLEEIYERAYEPSIREVFDGND